MPNCVAKMGKKWRVIECGTNRLVKNKSGTPVDGGGHDTKEAALKQARVITISQKE